MLFSFMRCLLVLGLVALASLQAAGEMSAPELPIYADVVPGRAFHFPGDHGAHPEFRQEWWYVTGWLDTEDGRSLGFQVTFFRFRPSVDQKNPSAFAAKQVLFAHAALSDPSVGKLLHDQRSARAGFGLAESSAADADVVLGDWAFVRSGDDRYHTKIAASDFTFDLTFSPTQPILLEGNGGFSRKGPQPGEASYYYSIPHLVVSGTVQRAGLSTLVKGTAWLDREWSSTYLDAKAVGWDWVGLNLDDGGALMAFQIRDASGGALWAGGSLRSKDGSLVRFKPEDVHFTPGRLWHSPHTGADYHVERTLSVRLPSGERQWPLKPLLDDQELDSRDGGGLVYWEGAVKTDGGRGYLELTGYFRPVKM